jgi:tetratricopeptide (TPR) repeat protein
MRRMRAETPEPSLMLDAERMDQLKNWGEELNGALRRGDFTAAFRLIEQMETLCRKMLDEGIEEHIEELGEWKLGIDLVFDGLYEQAKAYLMALNRDPFAIETCDGGFHLIQHGLFELATVASGFGLLGEELEKVEHVVENFHLLYRGMLKIAISDREGAVADLKSAFAKLTDKDLRLIDLEDGLDQIESLFLIKVLEQKLDASLLDERREVERQNPLSLFLAGRYEEALALVETNPEFAQDPDLSTFKAACYALMGQYDASLNWLKPKEDDLEEADPSIMIPAIYFLKGDRESAKEAVFEFNSPLSYVLLLAMAD